MTRERASAPTTDLADHLAQLKDRNWSRALRNLVVTNMDEADGGVDVKVPLVAPLRLDGIVVKVMPGRRKAVAITLKVMEGIAWWESSADEWYDLVSRQARVRVGDEIVVDAIVKRVRDARGGGKFLVVTTPRRVGP